MTEHSYTDEWILWGRFHVTLNFACRFTLFLYVNPSLGVNQTIQTRKEADQLIVIRKVWCHLQDFINLAIVAGNPWYRYTCHRMFYFMATTQTFSFHTYRRREKQMAHGRKWKQVKFTQFTIASFAVVA